MAQRHNSELLSDPYQFLRGRIPSIGNLKSMEGEEVRQDNIVYTDIHVEQFDAIPNQEGKIFGNRGNWNLHYCGNAQKQPILKE